MKPSEAVEFVRKLQAAYPRQECSPATAQVYAELLVDVSLEEATQALYSLIATSKYFPTVAEIREQIAEARLSLPHPDQALAEVRAYLSAPRDSETRPEWSCPEVGEAVKAVGGLWQFRTTTNPIALYSQFNRAFAAIRERRVTETRKAPVLQLASNSNLKLLK